MHHDTRQVNLRHDLRAAESDQRFDVRGANLVNLACTRWLEKRGLIGSRAETNAMTYGANAQKRRANPAA